jgi:hypothetical protein
MENICINCCNKEAEIEKLREKLKRLEELESLIGDYIELFLLKLEN